MIKKITVTLIFFLLFSFTVCAEENNTYSEQFKNSGADSLYDSLPDSAKEFFRKNNIDPSDYNWTSSLSGENVFSHIWDFIHSGSAAPLKSGAAILGIILITAAITSFVKESGAMTAAVYASVITVCAVAVTPIFSCVSATVNALKGSSVFMLSFIPVFAAIIAASGGAVTSGIMSSILLLVSEAVSYISAFVITPLMGGYLAVSISSSVSPLLNQTGIAEGIKKISMWIFSLVTTVFLGVLGIQTTVGNAADSLSLRTARFILGSAIPVAGTAVSEAFATVTASMQMLKASVGIYGVVAVAVIFLPLLLELILWRIALLVNYCAADIFSLTKISAVLKAADMMLSLLIGIILLIAVVFIISLTVVISVGK